MNTSRKWKKLNVQPGLMSIKHSGIGIVILIHDGLITPPPHAWF